MLDDMILAPHRPRIHQHQQPQSTDVALNKLLTFPMFEHNDHVDFLLETFPVESRMQPSKGAIRLQGPLSMFTQFNWGKVCRCCGRVMLIAYFESRAGAL